MSASSSKPQPPTPHLRLHVGTSATPTNGSAASPGSASSSHHPSRAPRPTTVGGGGSGSGQINQACAACKYQRRRCPPDCPLAPYFPADQQRRFINVHRLFGVSNVQKTLRRIEPKYGPDAMRSLIYQSEARAADPVGGCVGIIQELRRQIRETETELEFVRQQIAIFRQASATDGLSDQDPAAAAAAAAAMILPTAPVMAAGQQDDMVVAAVDAIYAAGQQPSMPAGDGGGGSALLFHGQQQDYHRVLNLKVEEEHNDLSSAHQQQLYDYFCYNSDGTAGDEATSDDDVGMQLGEQLGQQSQIEALPFVDAFNVKPQQVLPATIQHHGRPAAAGDVLLHSEQKKLATPVLMKHDDDVDEHMEEQQTTAGAPCHLELGFSSF